eukprot:g1578.t1
MVELQDRTARLQAACQNAENKLPGCNTTAKAPQTLAATIPRAQKFSCNQNGDRFFAGDQNPGGIVFARRQRGRTCLRKEEDAAAPAGMVVGAPNSMWSTGGASIRRVERMEARSQTVQGLLGGAPAEPAMRFIITINIVINFTTNNREVSAPKTSPRPAAGFAPPSRTTTGYNTEVFLNGSTRIATKPTAYNVNYENKCLHFDVVCLSTDLGTKENAPPARSLVLVYHLFDDTMRVIVPSASTSVAAGGASTITNRNFGQKHGYKNVKDGLEKVDSYGSFVKRGLYPELKPERDLAEIGAEFVLNGLRFRVTGMCEFTKAYVDQKRAGATSTAKSSPSDAADGDGAGAGEEDGNACCAPTSENDTLNRYFAPSQSTETSLQTVLAKLLTNLHQQDARKLFRQFDKEKDNVMCFEDFQTMLFWFGFRLSAADASRLFCFFVQDVGEHLPGATSSSTPTTTITFDCFLHVIHKGNMSRATPLPSFSETFLTRLLKTVDTLRATKKVTQDVLLLASLVTRSAWRNIVMRRFRQAQKSSLSGSIDVDARTIAEAFSCGDGDMSVSQERVEKVLEYMYGATSNSVPVDYVKFVAHLERIYFDLQQKK